MAVIIAKAIVMISTVRNSFARGSAIDKVFFSFGTMRVRYCTVSFGLVGTVCYLRYGGWGVPVFMSS